MKEHYRPGDWWLLCDQCGRKMRASESAKRWDGLIVHRSPDEGCWETRHPQEFVRPVRDNRPLPFTRPDNDGLEPTLATNCDVLTFVYVDNHFYNTLVTNWTVLKVRTTGPVTIPDGITITVTCTWEID